MFFQRHTFLWVVTISVLLVLVLPVLLQDGMFMDGMLYATISKNMANGNGSFWFPHYSMTMYAYFNQQPPLGFGIQSLFFSCFGNSMYVERFYSLLCLFLNAWLIVAIYRQIVSNELKKTGWLPVLLWITAPVCFWAFSNNLLENTMSIFDLLAVFFLLKYMHQHSGFVFVLVAGVCVFAATFTKGVQGAFPIATPFWYWMVFRKGSFMRMTFVSVVLLMLPAMLYAILLMNKDAYISFTTYMNHRVLNSIMNVSAVSNRFYLAGELFMQFLPALLLTGILWFSGRKMIDNKRYAKICLFFILVGLSASVPLMITLEQRNFYLLTSLPYFALGLSLLAIPALNAHILKINDRLIKIVTLCSFLIFVAVLSYSFTKVGKVSRDVEMVHDVNLIGSVVKHNTIIGSTRALWHDYSLQEYLVRKFYICTDDTILQQHRYFLVNNENEIPEKVNAVKVNIPTSKYHLYKIIIK